MQGHNPARFKGGYGVPRGFKGEKSKSPPNPLGLAERVPSSADDESPFSKQHHYNRRLQMQPTVAIPAPSKSAAFPKNRLHVLHVLHMSDVSEKKIFGVKAAGANSFHRRRRSPSLEEGGLGLRRSRPTAFPSIAYRGFAVAPITLRALSKNCCYNVGNKRARNARPYGVRRCN